MRATALQSLRAVAFTALVLAEHRHARADLSRLRCRGTGTATVVVRDAAGTQVYSGQLASSGQPVSSPTGVAGAWTIRVVYSNYSNTQVNFAVSKQ
jgi:hypothetical protein